MFAHYFTATDCLKLPGWGCSSAGRARRSQCRGQGFDPPHLHQSINPTKSQEAQNIFDIFAKNIADASYNYVLSINNIYDRRKA